MQKVRRVVVVVPTYNEKGSIEKLINSVISQNGKIPGFEIHVLVADSHSPDGTGEIARKLTINNNKVHFLDVLERGLGLGITEGYKYALKNLNADVLMQIDADLQHDPNDIPKFLEKINEGYEYVQGSRYARGGANKISLIRQLFSFGSSWVMRLMTGIWRISDFTPSFKAYTRDLYLRMNWSAVPWQGTTFLIQPSAVVEAYRAGAKMTEVPIVFRNRRADRSKNEIVNYIIDILGYGLEIRLSLWGIKFSVLYWARRSKTFIKFGAVGVVGTLVDFVFYNFFIGSFGIRPATSKAFSTEIAILNNFTLNNAWTFKRRKTKNNFWIKLLIFNIISLGGLAIGVLIIKLLHIIYGDGFVRIGLLKIPYYNMYFFATIPPVMLWNFTMNHFFTWKKDSAT